MVYAVQQAIEIPQLVDVLFFALVVTPAQMLCILAGMNQNDSYAAIAVYIFSSRCVPFFFRQAQDARHLGWLGPEGQLRSEDWLRSSSLRQWHVYCWYAGVDAMRAVFLLMVGRPVMPGIMGVAILVVPASRAAPSGTSPSFVVSGSRGTSRDGSDPRLLFLAPSVFACTVVRTGLRAFSSLSLEMDVSAAVMVSQMLSPMVWQRLVQSLRCASRTYMRIHQSVVESLVRTKCSSIYSLRVQAPVVVQRQVLQSRQCSTAWTDPAHDCDEMMGIFSGPCAQAHGGGGHVHRDMAPRISCTCLAWLLWWLWWLWWLWF